MEEASPLSLPFCTSGGGVSGFLLRVELLTIGQGYDETSQEAPPFYPRYVFL